ncbi:MAG: hypothetical protein HUJ93_07165, partial [Bacteroidales bacterium]|nr:hypothetical protein [Bacteroidales bacterium]
MNLKRLIIFFLTTVPLVANGTNVLLPESTRVGVSVSYEGDRHINRVARDYSNIFFSGFALFQRVEEQDSSATWTITLANDSKADIEIGSLWLSVSPPKVENKTHVSQTLMTHYSVSGNSSYIYWLPLNGKDDGVLMLPQGKTGFEFLSAPDYANESTERRFYIHGKWDASPDDTWHIPLSSVKLAPGERVEYSFLFVKTMSKYDVATQIAGLGGLTARIAPGLVTPVGKEVLCAFESRDSINGFDFEYPHRSNFTWKGKTTGGRELVSFKFRKQGENRVVVNYGDGKKAYLEFFVTEPFANLILKRAKHISEYQQHRDTSKWYDGLYSVWNMENGKLLSPEYRERFPEFTVGGSDDPSNCKPLFISEKNVFYPNKE